MSEELDDHPECTCGSLDDSHEGDCGLFERHSAKPIPVAQFEGEFVRKMEAKLPAIALEMEAGYPRGTHLKMEVEVRVRNVRYEEITSGPDKGELSRQHILALEEVRLLGAFTADELDPGVGGSASAAAIGKEPEEGDEGPKMSDCSSPLGTVCIDPACSLHFPTSGDLSPGEYREDVGF